MSSFQAPGDWSLSEAVGKRLLTPGGAVAPGVAPELMPVLVLENDRPENLLLSYQRMFARSSSVGAGGAGTRASAKLLNNRTDMLVTVELISAQVNFLISIERQGIPVGGAAFGVPRDTRIAQPGAALGPSSSATIITDNTLGAPTIFAFQGVANTLFTMPIVLGPGDLVALTAGTDASPLSGWSFCWRERRLNQSERF